MKSRELLVFDYELPVSCDTNGHVMDVRLFLTSNIHTDSRCFQVCEQLSEDTAAHWCDSALLRVDPQPTHQ